MIFINNTLALNFRHVTVVSPDSTRTNRVTECELISLDNGQRNVITKSMAKCHEKDNFNKDLGRKMSLKRLLDSYEPTKENKELRQEIWNAYRSRNATGKNQKVGVQV